MKTYFFKGVLQESGWIDNTKITVGDSGVIQAIESFEEGETSGDMLGYALPGFQNAHSHAFQYAMAGLAEQHGQSANSDDFWGWREAMYNLALSLEPEQMEAIAGMLYAEMLRHGYTHVVEFHYLHHDKNGKEYKDLAEMGSRLMAAAKTAGIGITLVPIFYQKGGFGKLPDNRQRRFISKSTDDYLKLLEASGETSRNYENANVGMGIHSLRAVEGPDLIEAINSSPAGLPIHIHVSEQLKEVEDALSYLGKRPVEWLLDKLQLNERYHLVHATHLTEDETVALARSGANVVLCPSTEGNLGDGIFPLRKFQEEGGSWSIGTDSHVGLNPFEELRILDYGQRLTTHRRNTFGHGESGDSGTFAINMITHAGRKATGNFSTSYFEVGKKLNTCILNASAPMLAETSKDNRCSTMVYSLDASAITATISQGELMVQNGQHINQHAIVEKFTDVIANLKNR